MTSAGPAPALTPAPRPGRPDVAFLLRHPAHLLALGFGVGLIPIAPGTFGTLLALPLAAALLGHLPGWGYLGVCLLLFALGVWACATTGRDLGVPDHGAIVWDEVVAFMAVLFFVPGRPLAQAFAFLLFRAFDIVKVPPAGWIDRNLKTGFGVMADDLVAGFYTLLVLALASRLAG